MSRATYKDIQRLTGLSLATISKFYNGKTVLMTNRAAIRAAADELGFRPNELARGLRSRRSRTVGVLLPALDSHFHLTIIAGVEQALREDHVGVLVCASRPEAGEAVEFLRSKMVDAIIAVPRLEDVPALQACVRDGIPVVVVDWSVDDLACDRVVLDNAGAGAMAARHLADHGHRSLAVVGGDRSVSTMRERADGFRAALASRGITLDEDHVSSSPLTVQGGHDAMVRMLALRERPTAFFCANQDLTLGAVIALNESGLRVPEDVSMVGFDSADFSPAMRPPLTMVAQPTRQIAAKAAAVIRRRLGEEASGGHSEVQTVTLPGRLVIGASVRAVHPLRSK